jgi:hypothetical protein
VHVPEQHRLSLAQGVPLGAHWHAPFWQLPVQQSLPVEHPPPVGEHAHRPFAPQLPEQQSDAAVQTTLVVAQPQVPFAQSSRCRSRRRCPRYTRSP